MALADVCLAELFSHLDHLILAASPCHSAPNSIFSSLSSPNPTPSPSPSPSTSLSPPPSLSLSLSLSLSPSPSPSPGLARPTSPLPPASVARLLLQHAPPPPYPPSPSGPVPTPKPKNRKLPQSKCPQLLCSPSPSSLFRHFNRFPSSSHLSNIPLIPHHSLHRNHSHRLLRPHPLRRRHRQRLRPRRHQPQLQPHSMSDQIQSLPSLTSPQSRSASSSSHPIPRSPSSDFLQAALLNTLNSRPLQSQPQPPPRQLDQSPPVHQAVPSIPLSSLHPTPLLRPLSDRPSSFHSSPSLQSPNDPPMLDFKPPPNISPLTSPPPPQPPPRPIPSPDSLPTQPFQTSFDRSHLSSLSPCAPTHNDSFGPSQPPVFHDRFHHHIPSSFASHLLDTPLSPRQPIHPDPIHQPIPLSLPQDSSLSPLGARPSPQKPSNRLTPHSFGPQSSSSPSTPADLLCGSPAPVQVVPTSLASPTHQTGLVPLLPTSLGTDSPRDAPDPVVSHIPTALASAPPLSGPSLTPALAAVDHGERQMSIVSNLDRSRPSEENEDDHQSLLPRYMAINLAKQIKSGLTPLTSPQSNSSPGWQTINHGSISPKTGHHHQHQRVHSDPSSILTSPSSTRTEKYVPHSNVGLRINSSLPPQELVISTGRVNRHILYTADPPPHILPITLFPSSMAFSPGRKVAVDGFISYATKAGRIRVIDQNSGARMLLRKHESQVLDMCIGRPRGNVGDTIAGGRRWRCIASIGADGRLVIYKVPVRFEEDTAGYEVLVDVASTPPLDQVAPESPKSRPELFSAIRWHPRDPSVLLLSTNDQRLVLIRLDRGAFAAPWKRGMPLGRSLTEAEAFEGQDVLRTSSNVLAFAFSPDGSTFAYVTQDNMLTVRQSSKPHWTLMGGQLPKSDSSVMKLEFLCTPAGRPVGFLIGKRMGTRVEVVELIEVSEPVITIDLKPPEDIDHSPVRQPRSSLPFFGHLAWQAQYSTILLSNSVRGSIFAFHLDFCHSLADEETNISRSMSGIEGHRSPQQDDDAGYIERVAARRQAAKMQRSRSNSWAASSTIFVDHISEVPSPDPIISFVLDEGMRPAPGPSSSDCSIFNIHPKGIHQMYLPREVMEPRTKTSEDDGLSVATCMGRRASLAGEILVDVEVQEEVADVEKLTFSQPSAPINDSLAPVDLPTNPALDSSPPTVASPQAIVQAPGPHTDLKFNSQPRQLPSESLTAELTPKLSEPVPQKLPTPTQLASEPCSQRASHPQAGAGPGKSHGKNTGRPRGRGRHNYSVSSISAADIAGTGIVGTNEGGGPADTHDFGISLTRELKRLEEALLDKFKTMLVSEMEKQEQRLEEERISHQAAETVRQETLMKLVSSTLTKNTGKVLEQVVRDEMKSVVLVGINRVVQSSVQESVRKGLQENVQKTLVHELEKLLVKPEITSQVANSLATSIEKRVEDKVSETMKVVMLPVLTEAAQTQQAAIKSVVKEMGGVSRGLNEVRAEARDKEEIRELKSMIESMQKQMAELQTAFRQVVMTGTASSHQSGQPALAQPSSERLPQQTIAHGVLKQSEREKSCSSAGLRAVPGPRAKHQLSDPSPMNSPSNLRESSGRSLPGVEGNEVDCRTPEADYEDMFLEALSDPSPQGLSKLIDGGSHDRLESIFHFNSNRGSSMNSPVLLSQAVVLTLAHRLSEEVKGAPQAKRFKYPQGHDGVDDDEASQGFGNNDDMKCLGKEGANRLRWIWSCVKSIDYQDRQTSQYLNRVLDLCWNNLNSRRIKMIELNGSKEEIHGINEVLRFIREKMGR